MSHRVKKDEKKREMRGPTFVGCRPVVEDGKRERKERMFQKHKNRKFEEQLAPTNCPGRIYPDLPGRAVSPLYYTTRRARCQALIRKFYS